MIPGLQTSENTDAIVKAIAKAQLKFEHPPRKIEGRIQDRTYMYADLSATLDAVRAHLNDVGVAVVSGTDFDEERGGWVLTTALLHESGQWLSSTLPLPSNVQPKEMGSWITYYRRYQLACLTGIASEEDDDADRAKAKPKSAPKGNEQKPRDTTKSEFEKEYKLLVERGKVALAALGAASPVDAMTELIDELLKPFKVDRASKLGTRKACVEFYGKMKAKVEQLEADADEEPGDITASQLKKPSRPSNFVTKYHALREAFFAKEVHSEIDWHKLVMKHLGAAGFETVEQIAQDAKARSDFIGHLTAATNEEIAKAKGL